MRVIYPNPLAAIRLRAAVRYYRAQDNASAKSSLESFLTSNPAMTGFSVDRILPKLGHSILLMARLRSDTGELHFLKISPPSDEFRFFLHGGTLNKALNRHGVKIVWPSLAIRTPTMLGLILPYHGFMLTHEHQLDLQSTAAAIAIINSNGQHLHNVIGRSKRRRRFFSLPVLIRRTILSIPFLTNERDTIARTVRAIVKYRRAQMSIKKVLCHGDITRDNIYRHQGTTIIIDFGKYFFAEPGLDLTNLYDGSEKHLSEACDHYTNHFEGPLLQPNLRLAVIYGHFLKYLNRAAQGRDSVGFRKALATLEDELGKHFS